MNSLLEATGVITLAIQNIHASLQHNFDVEKDRDGLTAAFILSARSISLSQTIHHLLSINDVSGASALYRILHEANDLVTFFTYAGSNNEQDRVIKQWFDSNYTPRSDKVGAYNSKCRARQIEEALKPDSLSNLKSAGKLDPTEQALLDAFQTMDWNSHAGSKVDTPGRQIIRGLSKDLNHDYSKYVHHAYATILETIFATSGGLDDGIGTFIYQTHRLPATIGNHARLFLSLVLETTQSFQLFVTMQPNEATSQLDDLSTIQSFLQDATFDETRVTNTITQIVQKYASG